MIQPFNIAKKKKKKDHLGLWYLVDPLNSRGA